MNKKCYFFILSIDKPIRLCYFYYKIQKFYTWRFVMKKKLSLFFAVILLFSFATPTVSAAATRLMPSNYYYYQEVTIPSSDDLIPMGRATFRVSIIGQYDLQGDNVISIDSETLSYKSGINCVSHDVKIKTWTSANARGYVYWQIVGEIVFGWTSPVSNTYVEEAVSFSPIYCFRPADYI